jgi:hypothetical protein
LPLITRELVGQAGRPIGKPEIFQRLHPRDPSNSRGDPVELQRQPDVLYRSKPGQQVEVLKHVADRSAPQPRPIVGDRVDNADPPTDTSPLVDSLLAL